MGSRKFLPLLKKTVNVIPALDSSITERAIQLYEHKNDASNVTVLYIPGNSFHICELIFKHKSNKLN